MLTQTYIRGFGETAARDEATARVLDNAGADWREAATAAVVAMTEREVTGEDVRLHCESLGIRPHHHNAWGGFVAALVRAEILLPTERYRAMKAKGSHARKTQVYRIP